MPLQPSVHSFEIKHFLSEFSFNVIQCNTLVKQQGSKAILMTCIRTAWLKFVYVIAWFVVIFGIKFHEWYFEIVIRNFHKPLGEWNLRQFENITSGIYAKLYHVQITLLFVYTTTHKRFVIFTCRYFKLSWNTTALSQSNCRNFSCSGIKWIMECDSCCLRKQEDILSETEHITKCSLLTGDQTCQMFQNSFCI